MKKYQDIINLPHHQSSVHPQMSRQDRAAQFSPFSALTGYEDAIDETARVTEEKLTLETEQLEKINMQLLYLSAHPVTVTVTYFVADTNKPGGKYIKKTGCVKKVKNYEHLLVLQDGAAIAFENIFSLEIPDMDE